MIITMAHTVFFALFVPTFRVRSHNGTVLGPMHAVLAVEPLMSMLELYLRQAS